MKASICWAVCWVGVWCSVAQVWQTLCDLTDCNPCITACQAPLSMGLSRQEYRSKLPCPPPGDLLDPGIEPTSSVSPAFAGGFGTAEPPGDPVSWVLVYNCRRDVSPFRALTSWWINFSCSTTYYSLVPTLHPNQSFLSAALYIQLNLEH